MLSGIFTIIIAACALLPSAIARPQSQPYESASVVAPAPDASHLYNLTRVFFESMIVPNNLVQLKGLNSSIFAEDITGRVSDSRKFLGRELNTEYVYGAFTGASVNESRITLIGFPRTTMTMRFAANPVDKTAFITEIMSFDIKLLGQTIPVQMDVWFKWNDNDEVQAYDARFVYFDWLMSDGMKTLKNRYNLPDVLHAQDLSKSMLISQICETAVASCQGDLLQYDSVPQCQEYLMNNKRMGQPFEFGVDTILCRSLHEGMLTLKPEAHCAHVGPSGGDMCTDNLDYATYVMDTDFFDPSNAGW
ncbi:uncharacterized protein AB675_1461 [Cyphellophora attinorum]|uniref:Secreted protein n=1 Tax=Cyphellophora attinorum TaxID=1664694 RepID=A0A0N1H5S6_9EURO|nr:uncharacterized protein AB675_1461 [Phialophora attinorum]KPI37205.1 hypothetical protein AB675_1461 [Phialophora attinorum]